MPTAPALRSLLVLLLAGCGGSGPPAARATPPNAAAPPGAEDGLLGRALLDSLPTRFVGKPPELSGHVVLARWWTDGCPFCERSLPALDALAAREGPRGLVTLGVYHPKPPRSVTDDEVLALARRVDWHGALAVDADWAALKTLWLDRHERAATSISILLDRRGRVRWMHPGPELHPSDDPEHAACARDFAALERVLAGLLAERD